MALAILLLALASIIGAGVLIKHQRWLTFIATAGALLEGQWLFITLLDRTILQTYDSYLVFTVGAVLIAGLWGLRWRKWHLPKWEGRLAFYKDVAVAAVIVATVAAAWLINTRNGFMDGNWVTHGFFNGDSVTLASLVQTSFHTDGFPRDNPFAAGTDLEYPTLLHAGLATALAGLSLEFGWYALWPLITYAQIIITVPLFFLLWDVIYPEPPEDWKRWFGIDSRFLILGLQTILVFYVMALAWDGYTYLQSHFFLTALFLLQAALLVVADKLRGTTQWLPLTAAAGLTLVLMLANAVTGTAAMIVLLVFAALRAYDTSRARRERLIALGTIPVALAVFLLATPGNASFGLVPHFSYTAALDMVRLAPIALVLSITFFWHLARYKFLSAASGALIAAAFLVFLFSTRNIIVENASRFFYHAILVGLPLLMFPLVRAAAWLRRELLYTTHDLPERATGWIVTATAISFFLLPALASGASTHDNLMFKDRQVISADMLAALEWINDHTSARDVIIASPDEPWAVPLFTGRSLLRTNYWLSVEDALTATVNAAFAGDHTAQQTAAQQADYLLLTAEQQSAWTTDAYEPTFQNQSVSVYRL